MATANLSLALPPAPAASRPYAKAHPGYGKRSAPDQRPPRDADFMLLPARERSIAGYIDHLPEGAAMDIKSLAKSLPLYGQMAVGTALRALSVAGHLRYVRCRGGEGGQVRWVTLTFWSRTARDNEWWGAFLNAEECPSPVVASPVVASPVVASPVAASPVVASPVAASPVVASPVAASPVVVSPVVVEEPAPIAAPAGPAAPTPRLVPRQRRPEPVAGGPSPAYLALARLGHIEPRLALSDADCLVLEELAAEWFVRGVDADYLTHALTSGLPAQVGSPVGFVRRRLNDKVPPRLPVTPSPAASDAPVRGLLVECADCRAPGPAEVLLDGLCGPCRRSAPDAAASPSPLADLPVERDVRAQVNHLRDLLRTP